ncbi:unnamed protein product [Parnassius mnemosyne]|uniref:Uncharacterized protein n=1 Tax=Parnassius mnemosyne TaxID=213953 RepID=A0AAV1L3L0_9NEOP
MDPEQLQNINNKDAMEVESKQDRKRGHDIEHSDEKNNHSKLKKYTVDNVDVHAIPKLDETHNTEEYDDIWNIGNFDEEYGVLSTCIEEPIRNESDESLNKKELTKHGEPQHSQKVAEGDPNINKKEEEEISPDELLDTFLKEFNASVEGPALGCVSL